MGETKTNFSSLQEGMTFSTFIDYNRLFDQYTKQYGLQYVVKSTRYFNSAKFADKNYNPDIVYSEYHMRCKAVSFDKEKKVEVDIHCPSEIKMVPRNENKVLLLKVFNQTHNHPVKAVADNEDTMARMEISKAVLADLLPALMAMNDIQFGQALDILKKLITPNPANDSFDINAASVVAIFNDKSSANSSINNEISKSANSTKSFDGGNFLDLIDADDDSEDDGNVNNGSENVGEQNIHVLRNVNQDKNEIVAQDEAEARKKRTDVKSMDRPNDLRKTEAGVAKRMGASINKRDSSIEPRQKIRKSSLREKVNEQSSSSCQKQSNESRSSSNADSISNLRVTRSRNQGRPQDRQKSDEIPSSAQSVTQSNSDFSDENLLQQHLLKQIVFKHLNYSEKIRIMLAWLGAPKRAIENILKKEYVLTEKDVRKNNENFKVTTLFNRIALEDLNMLRKCVTPDVYEIMSASVVVNEKNLQCQICANSVSQSTKLICPKCLKCYHFKCTGLKKSCRADWYCIQCK